MDRASHFTLCRVYLSFTWNFLKCFLRDLWDETSLHIPASLAGEIVWHNMCWKKKNVMVTLCTLQVTFYNKWGDLYSRTGYWMWGTIKNMRVQPEHLLCLLSTLVSSVHLEWIDPITCLHKNPVGFSPSFFCTRVNVANPVWLLMERILSCCKPVKSSMVTAVLYSPWIENVFKKSSRLFVWLDSEGSRRLEGSKKSEISFFEGSPFCCVCFYAVVFVGKV